MEENQNIFPKQEALILESIEIDSADREVIS